MNIIQLKKLCFIICICLSADVHAQIIPDSLRADWSHAGYQGTIPSPALIINVKDFGAYGDSMHDDYNAVMNAINSSSNLRVIYFPAGTYLIKSSVLLPSNVVLRGDGSNNTNLCFNLLSGDCIDITSTQTNSFTNIDSGYYKGSNIISSSNTLLKAGSYTELREVNGTWDVVPANWAKYCVGQIVKITSIQNKSVTIDAPLRINYLKSLQPQVRLINPVQNTGIECLKISRIDSTLNNYGYNINFSYAANCWVTGVESNKSQGSHIMLNASAHITVSGCYFHDAFTYDGTGTAGYGVTLIQHASDCKIENSVFRHLRHSMIAKQGANGNVFAYNYSFDPNRTEFPNDGGGDLLLHGHYAFANLFEGNIAQNIIIDQSWGPSGPYNTFFRNRAALYGIAIIDTAVASVQENYVGNEVTNTGTANGYPLGNYYLNSNTELTYGNNITGNIQPAGTNILTDSSYYLKARPYYWNITFSWPSIGVPSIIDSGSNPAKERYLSGGNLTSCIKEPSALSIVITTDSIVCGGSSTTIYAAASGGTGPYQYSIDGINFQSQNSFSKTAGMYTITVADAVADTVTAVIHFSQPTVITASLKKVNLTCYNDSSGSITVTASGGVKPYLYSANTGAYQSSNIFKTLKAGTYNITVKDSRNCILNIPATSITQPSLISIATTVKNVSCKNASDGSITITASKGISPYQYNLNGGAYQSSNTFSGLPAASYTVKVQDAKGCIVSKSAVKINNSTKVCSMVSSLSNKEINVNAYPNPFNASFALSISGNNNAAVIIKLTDMYGKELYFTKGTADHTYTIGAQLPAGIYFVEVIQGEYLKTLKIVKQ